MHLRRIEVRDFRKIDHRVIEGLDDGLNVIVGDNEAGKSTMLAALRAVFFERHTLSGKPIEAMLPYGAAVRPEIAVAFDIGGARWQLHKAFNQRPEAELVGPGVRLTGTAVEDRLAELLGFTPPGRGSSKPEEHHGTHGLLWVEQGTRDSLGVGAGRDTLAAALEREVGQVTGGDRGRILLAAAAERRDRFWTKTDKPRGAWKDLREEIDRLAGEQAALAARQQMHEIKIARLAEIGAALDRHRKGERLDRAIAAASAARAALTAAAALEGTLQHATAQRANAERERATADERRARRAALVAECAAARAGTEVAGTEAAETDTVAHHRDAQARAAEARLAEARRARTAAETRTQALDEALRRRHAEAVVTRAAAQLALVAGQDEARRTAIARAAAQALDRDALAALVRLEKAAEAARAASRAAGLQIAFAPDGIRRVTVDGADHPADVPLALTRDAVLHLEGFGTIAIRPGGGTADLSRGADAADQALRDALVGSRVETVAEARLALDAKAAALTEAAALAQSVAALAPDGIEALRQALDTERARLAQPLSDAAAAFIGTADEPSLAEARKAEGAARVTVETAERDAKAAAALHQEALLDAARHAERHGAARQRRDALTADLLRARAEADDDLLAARVQAAEATGSAALAAEDAARAARDAADPDGARLSLERSERAEREIRADIEGLDRERREIQAELRGGGQDGIGERLGEIEGLLAVRSRRLAATATEAAAARILHDALLEAQRDAKDRWLAPVRTRVSPYLKLMAPGSDILMDEHTLELEGLTRNGRTEPFADLSMGAREQIAVITRLALADVLRDAGHPAVVILDDALVNTDETRLDRMHDVLTRAAKGLQILVLTCRERDFIGLGKIHRLPSDGATL